MSRLVVALLVAGLVAGCVRTRVVEVERLVPVPTPAAPCLRQLPPLQPVYPGARSAPCPTGLWLLVTGLRRLELCYQPADAARLARWMVDARAWMSRAWLQCKAPSSAEEE